MKATYVCTLPSLGTNCTYINRCISEKIGERVLHLFHTRFIYNRCFIKKLVVRMLHMFVHFPSWVPTVLISIGVSQIK